MNPFQKMIDDVFAVPEFCEKFRTEAGVEIITIAYEVATDEVYTQFGIDEGVSFYLTCKVKDYTPRKGEKIIFRGSTYKIDSFTADSFNLTYKLFLKALSSK